MYFWVWGSGCWWWAFEAHLISPRFGFAPVVGFLGPSGYRHRTIKVFVRWDNKILPWTRIGKSWTPVLLVLNLVSDQQPMLDG